MNASKLIRHVMWVDVRAQRGLLAVWGFVLLAQAVLFAAGPEGFARGFARSPARGNYDVGIAMFRLGWTIIVAALLVQSDSLVATTAFWMTRPIPRAVLFTAKLLSAVLWFVAIPIAVMAAVLLQLGMGPLDAFAGAGLIGLEQAVILSMAIMAALVTANIGQLVVAGIAGVTLVAVFNGLLLPVLTLAWPSVGETLSGGQPTVYAVAVIAGGLAVAAYQYLTLRAWHSVAMVACAMFLATALARLWPAPPVVPAIGPVPESVMSTSAVSLDISTLAPRIADAVRMSQGKPERLKKIQIETTSAGHPPGIYFWPVVVSTDIRFPSLSPIQWSGPSTLTQVGSASTDREEGQPWRSIHLALGDVDLLTPRPLVYLTPIADVPEAAFRAHTSTPGRLKTDITMVAYRYEVTAVAPLKAGVGFGRAGRAGRILSVTSVNPGVRIELRETFMDGPPRLGHSGLGLSRYVLRNSTRRQAVLLAWRDFRKFTGTIGIAATVVTTTRGVLEVEIPPESAQRFSVDAAWLDDAELVLVEPQPLGVLTRSLVIDHFILGKPPAGGASGQPDGGSSASPLTQAGKTSLTGTRRRPYVLGPLSPSQSRPSRHVLRTDAVGLVRGAASETVLPLASALPAAMPEPRPGGVR